MEAKRTFAFEVVTVNDRGREVSHRPGKAEFLTEDLGDGVALDLVKIPGGTFQMGFDEFANEQPIHSVTVAPFGLGKYLVTQAQYEAVMWTNPSSFKGAKRPVENVSWRDAVEFCNRLSKKAGQCYRLPSEAEWEYACRAGTTTPFYFGATLTTDLANYDGTYTYANEPKGKYRQKTTEVGAFSPNAFGIYDMHGNVWEWCADHWHENYQGAPLDGSAWLSKNDPDYCMMRGGSFSDDPGRCLSGCRSCDPPDSRYNEVGFRVVSDAPRTL
jgi:eukaryotic-like serine/threonine-protein kinase